MAYRCTLLLILAGILASLVPLTGSEIYSCFREEVPEVPDPEFSKGVTKFGLNLFKQVIRAQEQEGRVGENTVMSPYSVWSALCLAFFGAEGQTKTQLARALRLTTKISTFNHWRFLNRMLSSDGAVTTMETFGGRINSKISNGRLNSKIRSRSSGAKSIFQSTNKAYFSHNMTLNPCLSASLVELSHLDFSRPVTAALKINMDVREATMGEIDNLVEPQDLLDVKFVLLNAVFFRGTWKTQFPLENTAPRMFHPTPVLSLGPVPMMTTLGSFKYAYRTPLEASLLELPYETGFSLLVLLPAGEAVLAEMVVEKLSRRRLEEARNLMTEVDIEVTIPKFYMTTSINDLLKKTLVELGIVDLFSSRSDLSSFSNSSDLQLHSAIHQAKVRVNEEGTVAAAATGLLGTRVGPVKFVCDSPFVFLIVDDLMHVPILTGVFNRPITDAPMTEDGHPSSRTVS
ncbi:hypothetical protein OTU49_002374 [Cherax quadricarinatus]|uniref:Serpin domain-containing protein n=1 Tax=Cherax quadricarinatus TaxID=27406 RepID=A0AAW0XQK7_CHEQU